MQALCVCALRALSHCHSSWIDKSHIFPRIENANPFRVVWRIKMLAFDWKIFISFCAPFQLALWLDGGSRGPHTISYQVFICLLLLVKRPIFSYRLFLLLMSLLLLSLFPSQLQPVFVNSKRKRRFFPTRIWFGLRWYNRYDTIRMVYFSSFKLRVQCAQHIKFHFLVVPFHIFAYLLWSQPSFNAFYHTVHWSCCHWHSLWVCVFFILSRFGLIDLISFHRGTFLPLIHSLSDFV